MLVHRAWCNPCAGIQLWSFCTHPAAPDSFLLAPPLQLMWRDAPPCPDARLKLPLLGIPPYTHQLPLMDCNPHAVRWQLSMAQAVGIVPGGRQMGWRSMLQAATQAGRVKQEASAIQPQHPRPACCWPATCQ